MKLSYRPLPIVALVVGTLFTASLSQAATLIHRYQFNNNVTDSVGTLNGTATGNNTNLEAPSYVASAPAGATGPANSISLGVNAGTKTSGFSIGNAVIDQSSGSLSFWLNPGTPVMGDTTSDYVIYEPTIGTGLFVAINPNVNATLSTRVGSPAAIGATGVVAPGTWIHTVITWDITTGVNLYVDGSLRATQTLNGFTSTAGLRFGNFDLSNVTTYLPNQYKGLIYDLQSYQGALTAPQISYLYSNPGATVPEPSAAMLGGLGMLGLGMFGRRRRHA